MMGKYVGKCIQGPLAGKMLVHWSKTYELLKPAMVLSSLFNRDGDNIIPVFIGRYHLNDFEMWMWHETGEGKAMRTLEG
jgi:hypothetical protein